MPKGAKGKTSETAATRRLKLWADEVDKASLAAIKKIQTSNSSANTAGKAPRLQFGAAADEKRLKKPPANGPRGSAKRKSYEHSETLSKNEKQQFSSLLEKVKLDGNLASDLNDLLIESEPASNKSEEDTSDNDRLSSPAMKRLVRK